MLLLLLLRSLHQATELPYHHHATSQVHWVAVPQRKSQKKQGLDPSALPPPWKQPPLISSSSSSAVPRISHIPLIRCLIHQTDPMVKEYSDGKIIETSDGSVYRIVGPRMIVLTDWVKLTEGNYKNQYVGSVRFDPRKGTQGMAGPTPSPNHVPSLK